MCVGTKLELNFFLEQLKMFFTQCSTKNFVFLIHNVQLKFFNFNFFSNAFEINFLKRLDFLVKNL